MERKSPYLVLGVILITLFVGWFIKQEYAVGFSSALASTSEPPKGCPTNGSPFETSINKMPFPGPTPHDIDGLCPRSVWSKFHDGGIANIQSVLPGLLKGRVAQHHAAGNQPLKVKVTGPLFYDASHQPCEFKPSGAILKSHSPARRTIWEIHPVYHIQVWAKNKWVDLEDWAQGQ